MKKTFSSIIAFVIPVVLIGVFTVPATAVEGIGPRRVTLPTESLAKEAYLTVPSGQWVAAVSYEYEILEDALYGRDETINTDNSFTLNNTLALDLTYGLSDNFTVNAIIPYKYVYNTRRVDSGLIAGTPGVLFNARRGSQGLGDVILMSYFKIKFGDLIRFGDSRYPRGDDGYDDYIDERRTEYAGLPQGAVFSIALGVRLPTGRTDVTDLDGVRLPDNLQLGTGTMDPIAGLLYHHRYYRMGWGMSGLYRISSQENIYHYQWGNEMIGSAYLSYRLNRSLEWVNQVNGTKLGRDRFNGAPTSNRGGTIMFYTPSLVYVGSKSVTVQVSVEIPVYRNFFETQLSSDYIINLRTSFLIN